MEEPIKRHNFEEAMKKIKEFSEQTITDLDLKKVDSDKGVGEILGDFLLGRGLGLDHKVTGSELNELTVQIQGYLTEINKMQKRIVEEFGKVYNALNALDEDYVPGILTGIKSAEKANREAKIAQDNIVKTVEEQKKIIKVLQKFKEKLDNFAHIEDIDRMWSELQTFQDIINDNNRSIVELESFKNRVDKYKHLSDIDKMWENNQSYKKDIKDIKASTKKLVTSVDGQDKAIAELLEKKAMLDSIEHLSEIDYLWKNVKEGDKKITSLSKQLEDLICKLKSQESTLSSNEKIIKKLNSLKHIYEIDDTYKVVDDIVKKIDNISKKIQEYSSSLEEINKAVHEMNNRMEKIDSMLDEYVELKENVKRLNESKVNLEKQNADLYSRLEEEHNKLEKMQSRFSSKIKMAYLLAGGAIGLMAIEFILVMLGMI